MHKYLAWVFFMFTVVGGDITYALYYYRTTGWEDGITSILAALFCTAVGVIPTLASTRGNDPEFRAKSALIAFMLGLACVVGGVKAYQLLRAHRMQDAALVRDTKRADKVKDAVIEARGKGLRSRDAAAVGKSVASVVTTEQQKAPVTAEDLAEPPWFPWLPWVAGFLCTVLCTVLLAKYWGAEDSNRDGVPDFLQRADAGESSRHR